MVHNVKFPNSQLKCYIEGKDWMVANKIEKNNNKIPRKQQNPPKKY